MAIITVQPNDPRLPPNLWLPMPDEAELLPDGRVVPLSLPPAVRVRFFPGLATSPAVEPVAPTIALPASTSTPLPATADEPAAAEEPLDA